MVEHRTLNPLVPSSSLGLPIPSDLAMCEVFEFLVIISILFGWGRHLDYSCRLNLPPSIGKEPIELGLQAAKTWA